MKQQYLQTGKIVSTHGVRGEVKLLPWADSPEFLLQFDTLWIGGRAYRVESSRVQKTCVLVKLAGIDTVEAASALRDQVVSIDRADAQLPQGSIFIADLLGLPVYDGETPIGRLTDVMSTPANDVYVVKGKDGQEHLIPAVPEFVLERNVDEGYIRVRVIPEIRVDGSAVSSTRIRRLLQTGRCEEAVRLLGHGQLVTGRVTRGAGRGAGLGFPTANVPFAPGVLVPAFGVYRAEAEVDGVRYPACVNIGVHPTVGALPAPLLEANLIGFAGDLYGKELAVWLQAHLRGEMRFESAAALRARVLYDRQLVADYYQK